MKELQGSDRLESIHSRTLTNGLNDQEQISAEGVQFVELNQETLQTFLAIMKNSKMIPSIYDPQTHMITRT